MLNLVSLHQDERPTVPLKINRYDVTVTTNNQVAKTEVNQVFVNPNDFAVDGIYIFPIQKGVTVSEHSLTVNGEPVKGGLFPEADARRLYSMSATHGGNTAILEHNGTQAFAVEVPDIPANGECRIQFEYSQIISVENDLVKYTYPLSLAKSASEPIENLRIDMKIESDVELRTVLSPAYEVTIDREDDRHVRISYEDTDVDPDDDFLCQYSLSEDNFGVTLITHRADEKEDGYFMLLVSPKHEVQQTEIIEKDFIFVLDHSGSMHGRKIEQAKSALRYCVQNLNAGDRFNLILFDTEITSLSSRLNTRETWVGRNASPDSSVASDQLLSVKEGRGAALAFIDGIEAGGATNINDALLTALAGTPDPDRPRVLVFLTDGCPTAGVTHTGRILENVAEANQNLSRIFVFGVGYDVDDRFLNKMAADNGGSCNYVEPDEHIEEAVSALFRKTNDPVLVDVEVNFGEIISKQLTPTQLPDVFRGEQLTVLGRYESHGDTRLKLRGTIGNEPYEVSKDVQFSKLETGNDFLPHLWAQRRIAELVDQVALGDNNPELRQEIERLSEEYGVLTPYTASSFVQREDGTLMRDVTVNLSEVYSPEITVQERVARHKVMTSRRSRISRARYEDIMEVGVYESPHPGGDRRHIGRKTFLRHDDKWIDNEYDGTSELKQVEFGSDVFDELLKDFPELARYTKIIGRDVFAIIICHKGVNYEITTPHV